MTKWSDFTADEKETLSNAFVTAFFAYSARGPGQNVGDTILTPLFDAIVKVADARRRFTSQPSSVEIGGMRIGVATDPDTRARVVFDHGSAVHRSEFEQLKQVVASLAEHVQNGDRSVDHDLKVYATRHEELKDKTEELRRAFNDVAGGHNRLFQRVDGAESRLRMLEQRDATRASVVKSIRDRVSAIEPQLIGRNPSGSRISELEARLSALENGLSEALAKISQLTPPRLREAPSFMPAANVAERLFALEGTIDVGFEELRTQIVALTPQRLRNARSEFHEDGRDGFFFTPDEWKKLPLDLKRRWWKETEYGTTSPSADLRLEVNKVLPSHFADVPTIVDTLTMTQEMADAVDALDPVDRDFEEPNPLDITAAAPFSAFAGDDSMKPHHVEAFVQEARDRTKAAFEASQSSGEENNVDQSEGA